jgi:oligopeptidase A
VLEGLFALAERLFAITISRHDGGVPFWHPSARYRIHAMRDGREVGGFFTDLFARPNKRGGAWMDVCTNRARCLRGSRTARSPIWSAISRRRSATRRRC